MASNGGHKYIYLHNESSPRQTVLQQLFRHSSALAFAKSGILEAAKNVAKNDGIFRFLEIGCGFGLNTFDVASLLPENARVTAIDANKDLIDGANRNLSMEQNLAFKDRIEFLAMSGEDVATSLAGQFDAVWIRFVTIHVPDPVALIRAAKDCLKPGGILLVEEPGGNSGQAVDPPVFAVSCLKAAYGSAREKTGADFLSGLKVGSFMKEIGGLEDIHCDSFHPLTGKGVIIPPWLGVQETPLGKWPPQEKLFELAIDFVRISLDTLEPKLLEMKEMTMDDLKKSRESLDEIAERDYQLFGRIGVVLQWWATRSKE